MTRRITTRARLAVVAIALALAAPPGAVAGEPADGSALPGGLPETVDRAEGHPGLAAPLAALLRSVDRRLPDRAPQVPGFDPVTDRVAVTVHPAPGRAAEAEGLLHALGASRVHVLTSAILAEVPVTALGALAATPSVGWVATTAVPIADVTGQGVAVTAAPAWHADGFTGAGVKVAIIDLGFAGYEALLGSELPAKVHTFDACGGDMGAPQDHGTAVAEIVHEMAPHATLYLMCITDSAGFADAVDHAIEQGAAVVNQSLAWFNTGRGDGTGVIADIVLTARQAGILWVNSAGNQAEQHWGGPFDDDDTPPNGWHEFATADEAISITLKDGQILAAHLRWDDWPASSNDYDLYLFADPPIDNVVLAASTDPQTGSQPPVESLQYQNTTGGDVLVHLAIHRFDAVESFEMDLFVLGLTQSQLPIEHRVAARSLADPASAPFVTAVGAFCHQDGVIRPFSARGPNIDGLTKPDLSAPDGVSNATFGGFTTCGAFTGFAGTSAASPHAAGAAALLRHAHGGCAPATLHDTLIGHTDPVLPAPNNDYGHGRLLLDDPPPAPDPVLRFAGPNRYATAAAISAADFPCGSGTVFVATGENFPDALAGAAVAARFDAPILLVRPDSIPPETAAELSRLNPDQVVILGGEAAVSAAVATQLASYGTVTRLSGPNRFATAAAVSGHAFPDPAAVTDVFVATGRGFPDALAGGPAAAYLDGPLLLVEQDSVPNATLVELGRLDPIRVWVLGGPAVVSDGVVAQLAGLGFTVARVAGANRYTTAVEASRLAFLAPTLETAGAIVHRVYIAVGTNFPDALAGAGVAGLRFAPVLLVEPTSVPQAVIDEIVRLAPLQIVILGGEAVVSAGVADTLRSLVP